MKADTQSTDLAACHRALDELLTAIIAYDQDEPAQDRRRELRTRFGGCTASNLDSMAFRSLMTDPVRSALCDGVKRIGRELYRLGGMDAMHAALDAVGDLRPMQAGLRGHITDVAWNGIGEENRRWWS